MKARLLPLLAMLLAASTKPSEVALPEMLLMPAGSFMMGAPDDADAQQGKPRHRVTIRAFKLSATPVTFDNYDAYALATRRPLPQDDGLGRGKRPVINLTRVDMLAYVAWLNARPSHKGFRLPSEAEWEYAARAGTQTGFYWGDEPDPRFANTRGTKGPDQFELTSPVASFPPNPWGLFDMAGNVWEMTADCLYPDYVGAPVDGSARTRSGCNRFVLRGGDYSSSRRGQRPTARAGAGPDMRSTSLGFRVAQD